MSNCDSHSETYNAYPTEDAIKASFASLCIDTLAQRLFCSPAVMYRRLKQFNIINDFIFRHYRTLHTQSLDYVVESILEVLNNNENSKEL